MGRFLRRLVRQPDHEAAETAESGRIGGLLRLLVRQADQKDGEAATTQRGGLLT